MTIRKI